jgi:hypothetical protein
MEIIFNWVKFENNKLNETSYITETVHKLLNIKIDSKFNFLNNFLNNYKFIPLFLKTDYNVFFFFI